MTDGTCGTQSRSASQGDPADDCSDLEYINHYETLIRAISDLPNKPAIISIEWVASSLLGDHSRLRNNIPDV